MGKFKSIVKAVSSVLGLSAPKSPTINIPKAELPTPPAPTAITDTGADVALGSGGDVKNQRVSGRSVVRRKTSGSVDILGGLGQSGLNI
jgi:hypothetical protein